MCCKLVNMVVILVQIVGPVQAEVSVSVKMVKQVHVAKELVADSENRQIDAGFICVFTIKGMWPRIPPQQIPLHTRCTPSPFPGEQNK